MLPNILLLLRVVREAYEQEEQEQDLARNPGDSSEGMFAPTGDCFRWAWGDAMRNGGTLVHGWYRNPIILRGGAVDYIAHAWVERDGLVYDWQRCDQGYGKCPITKRHFYRMYRPINTAKYPGTPKLAGKAYHEGHFGPWHKECWDELTRET